MMPLPPPLMSLAPCHHHLHAPAHPGPPVPHPPLPPFPRHLRLIAAPGDAALLPRNGQRGFPHWGVWSQWNNRFADDMNAYLGKDTRGMLSAVATRLTGVYGGGVSGEGGDGTIWNGAVRADGGYGQEGHRREARSTGHTQCCGNAAYRCGVGWGVASVRQEWRGAGCVYVMHSKWA